MTLKHRAPKAHCRRMHPYLLKCWHLTNPSQRQKHQPMRRLLIFLKPVPCLRPPCSSPLAQSVMAINGKQICAYVRPSPLKRVHFQKTLWPNSRSEKCRRKKPTNFILLTIKKVSKEYYSQIKSKKCPQNRSIYLFILRILL